MIPIELSRHFEAEPNQETLFPLNAELLEQRMALFEVSSESFLRMVTEARGKWGTASSLYANMPFTDLLEWHDEEEDFSPDAKLYYRAGLLYGMDIAKITRLHRSPFAKELTADYPGAFTKALFYMEDTYRGLDDENVYGQQRQVAREVHYTGSHILADASGTLYEHLSAKMGRELPRDVADNILALHVGMVDGAIFVDAYSAFEHGGHPRIFNETH